MEYPLRLWDLDRAACIRIIGDAGLPVPPKSACFFCPAMKQFEIEMLQRDDPELYALAIEMERLYRTGPHFRGDDFWTVKAKHKVTGEKLELSVQAASVGDARQQFRSTHDDEQRPYRWNVDAYKAVPGLGRSFAWGGL